MTNSDLTLLAILVDRSESMAACRAEMEGGLNTFIENLAEQDGQLEVTLAQFNTEYEIVIPPARFSGMTLRYVLEPRGDTALLDAMGRFITEIGESLSKTPEAKRPGKVIVCIVTDGEDDSSVHWTKEGVKKLVEQQRAEWGWDFVFLVAARERDVGVSAAVAVPVADMDQVSEACQAALNRALAATAAMG